MCKVWGTIRLNNDIDQKSVLMKAIIKVVEYAPAVIVLLYVSYQQQQQIKFLLENCSKLCGR